MPIFSPWWFKIFQTLCKMANITLVLSFLCEILSSYSLICKELTVSYFVRTQITAVNKYVFWKYAWNISQCIDSELYHCRLWMFCEPDNPVFIRAADIVMIISPKGIKVWEHVGGITWCRLCSISSLHWYLCLPAFIIIQYNKIQCTLILQI